MPDKPRRECPALVKKRPRTGIYSWVNSKKIPGGRAFQAVRRDLGVMREDLIRQHGAEEITPDAAILIDSIVEALGVQKLLGLYVRRYGVVDGQSAKHGRLELSPILAKNWISYGNTVRQAILALREIDKGQDHHDVITLADIIEEYPEGAKEPAAGEPGLTQDGRSDGGEGQDMGEGQGGEG